MTTIISWYGHEPVEIETIIELDKWLDLLSEEGTASTPALPGPRSAPQPERGRGDERAQRYVHPDALDQLPAARSDLRWEVIRR